MNLFRKKKESERIPGCDEPMQVEGLPPIPPYMVKAVHDFLKNDLLVAWMEEGVRAICKEIRELESKGASSARPYVEGDCAIRVRRGSLSIAGVWKKFENYHMKELRGELQEAMSLAVFKYVTDRLKQAGPEDLKDVPYRYELTYEGCRFEDYVDDYVYHIIVRFWIENPAYTENSDF